MTREEILLAFFENRKKKYRRWDSKEEVDEYVEKFFEYVNAGNKPLTLKELSHPPVTIILLESNQGPCTLLSTNAEEDHILKTEVPGPWDPSFVEEIEEHRLRLWFADEDAK